MNTHTEYIEKTKALRHDPMVEAWIAEYQKEACGEKLEDCNRCGWPHTPVLMCFSAPFGRIQLGRRFYTIAENNLVFMHGFIKGLAEWGGFHWRWNRYFKRDADGTVVVRFLEDYNNCPQITEWRIPATEWASIVCSVSAAGETAERWEAAQFFHGKP